MRNIGLLELFSLNLNELNVTFKLINNLLTGLVELFTLLLCSFEVVIHVLQFLIVFFNLRLCLLHHF